MVVVRLLVLVLGLPLVARGIQDVFPGEEWQVAKPEEVGLEKAGLKEFAQRVGGAGCIIRYGRMVYQWGAVTENRDWASASKPVLSTLLLLAVHNKRVPSVHTRVASLGWPLKGKDQGMSLWHLANMTSGYACPEAPGKAWGYNDLGIQLCAKSLERIFQSPLDEAGRRYLGALQFQDGEIFGSRRGLGVVLSPRDMGRLGWFWLKEGRWERTKLISNRLFNANVKVNVPPSLARTASKVDVDDYLGIGSYGGGTNQTPTGPGYYGFCFWFNTMLTNGERVWPSAPRDAFQANGAWNRDMVTVYPSLRMVVVVSMARHPGGFSPGNRAGMADKNLKVLMNSVLTDRPKRW